METEKILIIDDDIFIRTYIKDIFWIYGRNMFCIKDVDSLEKGEKEVKTFRPDIILLDLKFPQKELKHTLDFIKKIKSDPETKNIKIIIYSGYKEAKPLFKNIEIEDFIIKGKDLPKELFFKIKKIIDDGKK